MATRTFEAIFAGFPAEQSAIIPILRALQDECGYISEAAMVALADYLNLSRAEIYGVASFYHDFRLTDDQRKTVGLCGAEACQARGSKEIATAMELAAAGRVRIHTLYCLGLCSAGPAALVDNVPYARLDRLSATALIEAQC